MAQFTFAQYSAAQAARKTNSNYSGKELPKFHFMGEYLNKDGATAIVRFPYSKPDDLTFESVHKVVGVFPNNKYGKWVRCSGDDSCPLCESVNEDEKKRTMRFFAKMVVYTVEDGKVVLNPTIWDRPAMFADSDIKGLMTEYGDISNNLFKITKTGSGTATRYNILPVLNTAVYKPEVYVKDFSCLEGIDPVKILSKSVEAYKTALNGESTPAPTTTTETVAPSTTVATAEPVFEAEEAPSPVVESKPVENRPAANKRYTF